MKIINKNLLRFSLLLLLFASPWNTIASPKTLCVFDLLGANGPVFAQMRDYKIAALAWDVELQLRPYINELSATDDFRNGRCDAVVLTGTHSREFNRFCGSLDAVGALTSYDSLKTVIASISTEKARPLLVNGNYEVAGIIPVGAAFLYVNDRTLVSNQVDKHGDLKQVRVAIMEQDPVQAELINFIGTSYEDSSLPEMYTKFNEGLVDATYGPAVVYEAMELYRGMKANGGIIRFPLAQLSLQILIHRNRFPDSFAQQSRKFTLGQFDNAVLQAQNYENRIDADRWISISPEDQERYHEIFRKTRLSLLDKGVYSAKMLKVIHLVRCQKEFDSPECAQHTDLKAP